MVAAKGTWYYRCDYYLLPILSLGGVLGVGLWGTVQQLTADGHSSSASNRRKEAAFGCTLGALILLALVNARLIFALATSRRRIRELLGALLLSPQDGIMSLLGRAPADTPANMLLNMMGDLLEGRAPSTQEVIFIRTALLSNADVYQPVNLRATLKGANLDADVAQSLMNQLGGGGGDAGRGFPFRLTHTSSSGSDGGGAGREGCSTASRFPNPSIATAATITTTAAATTTRRAISATAGGAADTYPHVVIMPAELPSDVLSAVRLSNGSGPLRQPDVCESLTSALALILTPQPTIWQDPGTTTALDDAMMTSSTNKKNNVLKAGLEARRELKPPTAASLAAAAAALLTGERRAPALQASKTAAGALLEKATSLMDRSRRQRRASVDTRTQHQITSVADEARDTAKSHTSLHAFASARCGSTAGSHDNNNCSSNNNCNPSSAVNVVRLDFRCSSLLVPGSNTTTVAMDEHAFPAATTIASCGGGDGGAEDEEDIDDSATGTITGDGESCGGRLLAAATAPPLQPSVETLVPRRLSAVWGIMSKRNNNNSATPSGGSCNLTLDGNPNTAPHVSAGGRVSPSLSPRSFTARRTSGTQSPWSIVASELLQHAHSRLGLGGGSGGSALQRAANVRAAASEVATVSSVIDMRTATAAAAVAAANAAAAAAAAEEAAKKSMPPPAAVLEEVERLLSGADGWQFDTWGLQAATGGHALSALGFYIIQREGLIKAFRIQPVTLARLLRQVEAGYMDNPYHNAVHAADVLQTLHVIIHTAQLHIHYLDPLGLLAAYYAAIVHDYGHPGVTNDFLVAVSDPLAVRYNDRSPLENHHCAAAFELLQKPELDFLAPLTKAERTTFRKQAIDMVLATDMKQHFSILSHFNTVHRLAAYSQHQQQQQQSAAATPSPPAPSNKQQKRTMRRTITRALSTINDSTQDMPAVPSTAFAAFWSEPPPKPLDETERLLSLQVALKAADIGHLGEELTVHQRWLAALEEEFFLQGDRERALGLPISPLFDRAKQGVSKSQVGFYDFVALPLLHALTGAFPGTQQLMKCFVGNYNHWRQVEGQQPLEIPTAAAAGGDKPGPGGRRGGQQQQQQQQQQSSATAAAAMAAANAPTAPASSPAGVVLSAATFPANAADVARRVSEQGDGLESLLLAVPDDAVLSVVLAGSDDKV